MFEYDPKAILSGVTQDVKIIMTDVEGRWIPTLELYNPFNNVYLIKLIKNYIFSSTSFYAEMKVPFKVHFSEKKIMNLRNI